MRQNSAISILEFCGLERIPLETFRRLDRQGFMPRRTIKGPKRWPLIGADELEAWRAQRDADAKREGRPWIKYPTARLSWVPEKELAGEVAARVEYELQRMDRPRANAQ